MAFKVTTESKELVTGAIRVCASRRNCPTQMLFGVAPGIHFLNCSSAQSCREACLKKFGPSKAWKADDGDPIAIGNRTRAFSTCMNEVEKREKQAMRNYFEFWRGRYGRPCGAFCRVMPKEDYVSKATRGMYRMFRKATFVKHHAAKLVQAYGALPETMKQVKNAKKVEGKMREMTEQDIRAYKERAWNDFENK